MFLSASFVPPDGSFIEVCSSQCAFLSATCNISLRQRKMHFFYLLFVFFVTFSYFHQIKVPNMKLPVRI